MQPNAKILLDSISPDGFRLITFEVVSARYMLPEINTHRILTKNSASSRAMPVNKTIERVINNPYIPVHWGENQKGMQAEQEVGPDVAALAKADWLKARDFAVDQASSLLERGIHKQVTNRLLEPFMYHTCLLTGTEFSNFFNLRNHKDAQPDIKIVAEIMKDLYNKNEPQLLGYGRWHCPLVPDMVQLFKEFIETRSSFETNKIKDEDFWDPVKKISIGRCARVSYMTHSGKRDWKADIELYNRMILDGHLTPFEHVARPMTKEELELFKQNQMHWTGSEWKRTGKCTYFLGNIQGWVQARKMIPYEEDILGSKD